MCALGDETWRVFCAIEMPPDVCERALAHIKKLREAVPDASAGWNRDGNFHLTIKFLGEVALARVRDLSEAASRAAKEIPPFQIAVGDTGVFPKSGPPRVLWVGINDESGGLKRLHDRLEDECEAAGFSPEERSFHPHLTLARIRKPPGAKALGNIHQETGFEVIEVNVRELLVIRSELSSKGSKYSTISTHTLG
jgi:RNA 2',3'-cyclic 3'-phosphodiesterase